MKLTIFPKLFLIMLLLTLLPLIGLGYLDYRREQRSLETQLEQNIVQTARATVGKVNAWADINLRALRNAAALSDVRSMDMARQTPILQTMGETYEWTYLVFTMDLDGYMTARNDDEKEPIYKADGSKAHFRGDRPYFLQVLQGQPFGQQVLISRTNNQPAQCLSVPIHGANAALSGVLIECSLLVEISKAITDIKIGKTGFAFLVDDTGKVLAHGQQKKIKEVLQDFRTHPAFKQSPNRLATITDDGKPVVAYVMNADMGWKLVVQQDEGEAFASLYEAQRNAIILLVLAVGLVGLLAFMSARGLTKSLRELTTVADGYSRGELDATIPGTQRSDEIGALARAVERMGISIKIAFETLSRKSSAGA